MVEVRNEESGTEEGYMEEQRSSFILIVCSHVFSSSYEMGFPGRRRPFYVLSLSHALFSGRPLASQVNSKHFSLKSSFLLLQELLPASPSNARLITWLTEWQSRDSGLFVTENCLRRFKGRLEGSRVRAAHICKVLLGAEKATWGFLKVSAVRNEDDKGADNTLIWPVSNSWHSSCSQPQGHCSGEQHCVAVCLSEPLAWGWPVFLKKKGILILCSFWHGCLNNCTIIQKWMP